MGFFDRFFKRDPPRETKITAVNIQGGSFSSWQGNAYANDIFRGAVDAIARNAAKLKAVHTVTYGGGNRQPSNDRRLQRILQVSPNALMSAYDLQYKLASHYYLHNNAFAVLDWDSRGQLAGIYPVNYVHVDFAADEAGGLYVKFRFRNGREGIFSYDDVIHLRRHFNSNELLGDDNRALDAVLELAHTQNEGSIAGIKAAANIRGLLKVEQLLVPEKLKALKDQFVRDFLSIENSGGVAALDKQASFVPLESKPVTVDEGQLKLVRDKIYNYLGVGEKIVNSSYTEDEFSAFYESTIEPLATQLSLEFTRKIFNDRERAFGNEIVFESGRLQFTANATKVNLIKELMPLGLLTVNQALEILNLAPVEGGDRRLQTLNVVDADKVTQYQLGKAGIKNDRISDGGGDDSGAGNDA